MEKISILNIGAGKVSTCDEIYNYSKDKNYFKINLDSGYFASTLTPESAEEDHNNWINGIGSNVINIKCTSTTFLEKYKYKFDVIIMHRFFEHIPRDKLLYFVYLLSSSIKKKGIVDIISPDFKILSKMILRENPLRPDFDKHDIIVSTEMFNEECDPHLNITTIDRTRRLFEYEGRFKVIKEYDNYFFDDRNIYFRSIIERK